MSLRLALLIVYFLVMNSKSCRRKIKSGAVILQWNTWGEYQREILEGNISEEY